MSLAPPFSAEHRADPFGDWPQWRRDMGLGPHRGMDWNGLAAGTPIPASGSGVCVSEGWSDALGWWVVIRYTVDGADVYFGYCHMQERTHLRYGVWVATGDRVGRIGSTGSATTGAHLHLTASRQNGNPGIVPVIDPADFLAAAAPAGPGTTTPIQGENDMSMDTIRHPNGSISFADEMGSEDAGSYRSADIGAEEYLGTLSRVFGGWDQLTAREFDIAVAISQRRWANKKAQIVNDVVAKLTPIITGAKPVIDPELIRATIKEGLVGLAIEADVDDETITAIANKVADVQHERLAG